MSIKYVKILVQIFLLTKSAFYEEKNYKNKITF